MKMKVMPRVHGWVVPAFVTGVLTGTGCAGGGPAPGMPSDPNAMPTKMRIFDAAKAAATDMAKDAAKLRKAQK